MTHQSWAFHTDEALVQKLITPGSDYSGAFNVTGKLSRLIVGKDDSAIMTVYRSPSSAILFGVCYKTDLEASGLTCFTLATTRVATYEIDLPTQAFERANRLECVVTALRFLEDAAEMHDE